MIVLGFAVQTKGFGFWFRWSIQSVMAAWSWDTLSKVPRRMRCRVISANRRSTRFSQDDEVGVKCSVKRG